MAHDPKAGCTSSSGSASRGFEEECGGTGSRVRFRPEEHAAILVLSTDPFAFVLRSPQAFSKSELKSRGSCDGWRQKEA